VAIIVGPTTRAATVSRSPAMRPSDLRRRRARTPSVDPVNVVLDLALPMIPNPVFVRSDRPPGGSVATVDPRLSRRHTFEGETLTPNDGYAGRSR
jgi:hypothetical protein